MNIANYISKEYGYMSKKNFNTFEKLLKKVFNFQKPSTFNINTFIKALKKDKKAINNYVRIILIKSLGKGFVKNQIFDFKFKKILNKYFKAYFIN